MAILLNDAELSALEGLPFAAVCLYVMAIRPRMDLKNGMVGVRYLISWQAIKESLYVDPAQGRTDSGALHESSIRRLSAQLEKAGLIKNSSVSSAKQSNRQLIFKCLLATHDKCLENKPDREADREADRPLRASKSIKTGKTVIENNKADRQPDSEPDTHPSFSSLVLKESSSVLENPTDDDIESDPSKSNPKNLHLAVGSEELQSSAIRMVQDMSTKDAQRVLDQFAGAVRNGGVKFPLRYLKSIIVSFQQGDFIGELANQESASRNRKNKEQMERLEEKAKPVQQRNSEFALAAIAQFKLNKKQGFNNHKSVK